jgi:phosphohistidine phosphatase
MELYFLRHGIASRRDDPKYKDDSLRPLTAKGREKMQYVALGMKNLDLTFDIILSSPYVRAKQTAEIVAKYGRTQGPPLRIKNKKIHLTNNLLPPASIEELLKEVHDSFPKSKKVLFVGHEPHLTEMISSLLKSDKPLNIDLKKGGLCCLNIDEASSKNANASLMWLLIPTQLGLMSKEKQ